MGIELQRSVIGVRDSHDTVMIGAILRTKLLTHKSLSIELLGKASWKWHWTLMALVEKQA